MFLPRPPSTKGRSSRKLILSAKIDSSLITDQYHSIMTALLELGAFIGALQAGFVADKYSRKKAIGLSFSDFLFSDQVINISV